MRLVGVHRTQGIRVTEVMLKLEMKLKVERREILFQEEFLWKQKSRMDWLKWGDVNTKFFLTSTLVRRRWNMIDALLNDSGE